MKIYVVSDTHFSHTKIIEYCNRPENYEELLWDSLSRISAEDCLIHLGDVCIGEDEKNNLGICGIRARKKILVLGNHDTKSWSWYMDHGWDFVCESFKLEYCGKKICFSHKPQPWDGDWEINVHGHLHNLGHRDHEFKELKQWHRLYAPELMNYRPIELSEFIQSSKFGGK